MRGLLLLVACWQVHDICGQGIPWPPKMGYRNQKIDHFNYKSTKRELTIVFGQRYFYEDKWFKPGGPIFFYCGNEAGIDSFWNNTGFIFELAPKFNALVVFGEHRYYGKSLPFGPRVAFQQPYIQYLSIDQALADFVYLITDIKSIFNASNSSVITFGGSYGGNLAAYMRFKYPNVVSGALVSSAPLGWNAGSPGFHQFFELVTKDFRDENPAGVDVVRAGFQTISSLAAKGAVGYQQISTLLNTCQNITSMADVTHALKYLRNGFVMLAMLNYPYATNLVGDLPAFPVREASKRLVEPSSSPVEALRKAAAVFYGQKSCYSLDELFMECADITGCGLGSDSMAWDFQACTEIKLYDESNATINDMFPSLPLTEKEVRKYCDKTWEVQRSPDQLRLLEWGTDMRAATNVIFSNGDLDPWSLGGIMSNASLPASSIALIIKGGAHHLDFRSSNPADPPSVIEVRQVEENWIRKWLQ